MANTAQARKRVRQNEKRRQRNASQKSMLRTKVKKIFSAISSGNKADAESAYSEAVPVLDQMARKGIIHKNKAARYKTRFSAQIKAL